MIFTEVGDLRLSLYVSADVEGAFVALATQPRPRYNMP